MRLINVRSLALHEFYGEAIPTYSILSHTWNDGEVTYQDWQAGDHSVLSQRRGYAKILGACRQAERHGIEWLWVDTNCIDKTSSAELTEAINSMCHWYKNAETCYAYLVDVATATMDPEERLRQFRASRWFTRGWTLQELLAPKSLTFYAADWTEIGVKDGSLAADVFAATGIGIDFLTSWESIMSASVSKRMSWLAKRSTTRVEDMAYCMLGLFDINMPLLYGEGAKAFTRLQEEIIKVSDDHTIFCWSWDSSVPKDWVSLLAPSPRAYANAGAFVRTQYTASADLEQISMFSMTNAGLSIQLPLLCSWSFHLAVLNAGVQILGSAFVPFNMVCIPIIGEPTKDALRAARLPYPRDPVVITYTAFYFRRSRRVSLPRPEPLVAITRLDRMKWVFDKWKGAEDLPCRFGLLFLFESEQVRSAWMSPSVSLPEQAFYKPTGILGLDVRENIGACLINLSLTFNKAGIARWRKKGGFLAFFAVRLTGGSPEWFCEIRLPEPECSPYDEMAMEDQLNQWKVKVMQSKEKQTSSREGKSGVWIEIIDRFDPSATQHTTMMIQIGQGGEHRYLKDGSQSDRASMVVEPDLED